MNLYGFVGNDGVNRCDKLGLVSPWIDPPFVYPPIDPIGIAVSSYIATFITSEPLPKKLFNRYRSKSKIEFKLSKSDMREADFVTAAIWATDEFEKVKRIPGVYVVYDWKYLNSASKPATLNDFWTHFDGILCIESPGKGWFIGKMYATDDYDFNPREWGGRSFWGEVKTRAVNLFASGEGFPVTSEKVDFEQKFPMYKSHGTW